MTEGMLSRRRNIPLALGLTLVALTALLAVIGPLVAPHDPLATNTVVQVDGKWVAVPYPPFTVPGFPLGSDTFGRDQLSRLLWGIRPTMILVTLVALARLGLGVLIGMDAGWATGRRARAWEGVIAAALAVPGIITALAAITAVGIERGLPAFLIGLTLTGWAETARLVSEQTRSLKSQPYIEAARAMGASGLESLIRHVLRQIAPLLGMLLAFEAGATLMTVAALGFLGYYLGGAFWVEVTDFSARAISGLPELGQMLANSWQIFKPWATVATGSVIFMAVLGFNLTGEGLRRRLSVAGLSRRSRLNEALNRAGAALEETLLVPTAAMRRRRQILGAVAVMMVAGGIALAWQPWQPKQAASVPAAALAALPGGHAWAAERRDPAGTLFSPATDPIAPMLRWILPSSTGFSGTPAVDAAGNVYMAGNAGTLFALTRAGVIRWQQQLPAPPAGGLALGPAAPGQAASAGTVYVTDMAGGLVAFTLEGDYLWRFQTQTKRRASSGAVVGPDAIYYTVVDRVEAVTPAGSSLWTSARLPGSGEGAPRLAPRGDWLFVQDAVLNRQDGKLVNLSYVVPAGKAGINAVYMVGGDGLLYLRDGHAVYRWEPTADGGKRVAEAAWEYRTSTLYLPIDSLVSSGSLAWLMYVSAYDDLRLVALAMEGGPLANIFYPQRESRLIAADAAGRVYVCGDTRGTGAECAAFTVSSDAPVWRVTLSETGRVNGGALTSGRLYVTTSDGAAYAVGDE